MLVLVCDLFLVLVTVNCTNMFSLIFTNVQDSFSSSYCYQQAFSFSYCFSSTYSEFPFTKY